MNRRVFANGCMSLVGASLLGRHKSLLTQTAASTSLAKRPNIVFMLLDDLGWGDLGCYGNTYHETPNIDQLAHEGMRFSQAYAAAPVCSPSRACIMTGQAPARLHLTQWIPGSTPAHKKLIEAKSALQLEAGTPTIASELKKVGYRTAAIGKWHLGDKGALPEDFGFDENIAGDQHGHPGPPHGYFGPFRYHNLDGYSEQDNLTEVLSDKVDDFLERNAGTAPFFLYLAEYAVHLPLEDRKARVEKYRRKDPHRDVSQVVYAAMVETVDLAVARLRKKLQDLKIADNTLIMLTSDNGGVGFQGRNLHRIADNGGLRGGKGYVYEGGIREPLIVHWPGVVKAGSASSVPVSGADYLPTLLTAAKVSKRGSNTGVADGEDFTPVLMGNGGLHRSTLYWHYPHYSDQGGTPAGAIREGDWKLLEFFEDSHLELYNLALDPGEQYDLASNFSERAADLQAKLHAWRESLHASMPAANPAYDPRAVPRGTGEPCSTVPAAVCAEP